MIYIKYYKFKSVSSDTSFKILNYVVLCTLVCLGNKFFTVKLTLSISKKMKRIMFFLWMANQQLMWVVMKILCGHKFIVTCWYKCKEREESLNLILFWNVWNCIILKWDVGLDCHFCLKQTQTQTTAQLPGFVWNGWWL